VAKARGMSVEVVLRKIEDHTERRTLGILGEQRVNVLILNLDLEGRS
jgi:K+-transporting ATPase ATPase C chain